MTSDDMTLVREFAATRSETAFSTLVQRHIGLVHSAALRQVGDSHLAEEITQAVFLILARKVASLGPKTILAAWLYRTTRFAAADTLRNQRRRQAREQKALMQSTMVQPETDVWAQVAPLLDEAMAELNETDRTALVLRYFENKTAREIAQALRMEDETAQKRITRALEKLRGIFAKRGVGLTTTVIAGVMATNAVQAAPTGLAATVTAAGAQGAAVGSSTLSLIKTTLKLMAWTKAKTAIVIGVGTLLTVAVSSVLFSNAFRGDREARKILEKVLQNYKSLSAYNSTGTTVEEIDYKTLTALFSMRLGRPYNYLLEYEQHAPTFTNKGALWSDGSGDYFANDVAKHVSKSPFPRPDGLSKNLDGMADLTGGATAVIPSIFFGIQMNDGRYFDTMAEPAKWAGLRLIKERDERIGETDCHVLSVETDQGKALLWIGKKDFLIHQSQQRSKRDFEATDNEIKLLSVGFPLPLPIEEMKRRINEGRIKADATRKPVTVVFSTKKGVPGLNSMTIEPQALFTIFTQTHENIVVNPKFSSKDFAR